MYYYLFDGLGSVVGITNSSGTEIISYTYDAWGNATMYGSGVSNPWQYAGGYADATGLLKFGERYYDPGLGRWTQQDPIGGSLFDPGSGNRYIYANDDPINLVDQSGADAALCGVLLLASITAAIATFGFASGWTTIGLSLALDFITAGLYIAGLGGPIGLLIAAGGLLLAAASVTFFVGLEVAPTVGVLYGTCGV